MMMYLVIVLLLFHESVIEREMMEDGTCVVNRRIDCTL